MKTLGILGGMGPYATLDFMKKVLDNTPARKDWDHIRMIVDNNPHIPSRTRAIQLGENSPVPGMVASINMLKAAGAEVIAIPCNSAHYFLPEVIQQVDVRILNMIEITLNHIRSLGSVRRIGIMGGWITVKKRLYECNDFEVLYLPDEQFQESLEIIEAVKQNRVPKDASRLLAYFNNCDCVVLACTELPIAIRVTDKVIDAGDLLAKEVVRFCK